MYTVHDCFGVTANNIESLIKCLKSVYLKIYSEDTYLMKFDEGIIQSIKAHFGENSFYSTSTSTSTTKEIRVGDLKLDYPDINKVIKGKIASQTITKSQYLLT